MSRKRFLCSLYLAGIALLSSLSVPAQTSTDASAKARTILDQLKNLRTLPDDVRARTTKQLALDIRELPPSIGKVSLASNLANFSTEGDFGRETLVEVANTLAQALREQPPAMNGKEPAYPFVQLAQLARYEKVPVTSKDPQFKAAIANLEAADEARRGADFTLQDLEGNSWKLRSLRGKVVLLNFWATWCGPCRKEMPDLETLYQKFGKHGLVVLAISDEDITKVKQFVTEQRLSFPFLLDPGRTVKELFRVDGIPKSFIYDREGKLVAQSIDMRTRKQFLELLSKAGLK